MVGRVVTTPALVTVFPFLHAFADAHPADRSLLEDLLAVQFISALDSDYAAGETNDAGSVDVLPLYTELTVNGDPVTVCSTDEFTSPRTGAENKLGSRQFIRFTPASGTVRIRVAASLIPEGEYSDPDWRLYRFDQLVGVSIESPNAACENYAASNWTPGNCVEPNPGSVAEPAVVVGAEHILEVYEWTHIIDDDDHPPIGRTCFNVTVTQ
jgi:hypothetical protein